MRKLLLPVLLLMAHTVWAQSPPRLLVLSHDRFADEAAEWVRWKRILGMEAELMLLSEVGALPDAGDIRTKLREYHKEFPFDHLLLVGDVYWIPTFIGINQNIHDHGYTLKDNEDYLPDWAVGRWPVNEPGETAALVARAIRYERGLAGTGTDWYSRALVAVSTLHYDDAHGLHLADTLPQFGFEPHLLRQADFSLTRQALLDAFTSGTAFAAYFGHGSSVAWINVAGGFTVTDVDAHTFGAPTVVLSAACATAAIDNPGGPSLAEAMFLNGALAVAASPDNSYYDYSDTLIKHTLYAYLAGGHTLGRGLNVGKMAVHTAFPTNFQQLTELTMQHFLLLGDPSIRPFTAAPLTIVAQHDMPAFAGQVFQLKATVAGLDASDSLRVTLSTTGLDWQWKTMTRNEYPVMLNLPHNLKGDSLIVAIDHPRAGAYVSTVAITRVTPPPPPPYPIPAGHQLTVPLLEDGESDVILYSADGRTAQRATGSRPHLKLPLDGLPNGIYMLEVRGPGGMTYHTKVAIQR